jgi:hypothetical protein
VDGRYGVLRDMRANDIPIASPCTVDWRTMKPSDTKRFCETCKKHVHDLSSMTKVDARALLASPPTEGLCVRYLFDARGEIVFRPIPATMLSRAKRFATAAAAVSLPMAIAACSGAVNDIPQPTMGVVACPLPLPPEASPDAAADVPTPPPQEILGEPPALPPQTR